jgi:hypothetical protein
MEKQKSDCDESPPPPTPPFAEHQKTVLSRATNPIANPHTWALIERGTFGSSRESAGGNGDAFIV